MTNGEKTLVFRNFCMVAQCDNPGKVYGNVITVKIHELTRNDERNPEYKFENENVIKWEYPGSSGKSTNTSTAPKSINIGPVLHFKAVEDFSSGLMFPVILVQFVNCADNSISYCTFIVHEDDTSSGKPWELRPIKSFTISSPESDVIDKNIILLSPTTILYHRHGKLFSCSGVNKSEVILENEDKRSEKSKSKEILQVTLFKNSINEFFIVALCDLKTRETSRKGGDKISGCSRSETHSEIFIKRVLLDTDGNLRFQEIENCKIFHGTQSNISQFYIHSIDEVMRIWEEDTEAQYNSHIFVIASNEFLLEFRSGKLIHSICLEEIFNECGCHLESNQDDCLEIVGVLENLEKKFVILRSGKSCIALDLDTKKVSRYWSNVESLSICDMLFNGRDQLLLVFQPLLEEGQLDQWVLTDLDTINVDNTEDAEDTDTEDEPKDKDADLSARKALTGQLQCCGAEDAGSSDAAGGIDGAVDADDLWYCMVDDQMVVGLTVTNNTNSPISRTSLSLTQDSPVSGSLLESVSKWHRGNAPPENLANEGGSPVFKKRKIGGAADDGLTPKSQPVHSGRCLQPKEEAVLTVACGVLSLNLAGGSVTLSVFLKYCLGDTEYQTNPRVILKNCQRQLVLHTADILDNSLVERLGQTSIFISQADEQLQKDKLCLDTIQDCKEFIIKKRHGGGSGAGNLLDVLEQIPGFINHGGLSCYICIKPGVFYLLRLQISDWDNPEEAEARIYYRSEHQMALFLQHLKMAVSDDVYYQQTRGKSSENVKLFLDQSLDEINTTLSLIRHLEGSRDQNKEGIHSGMAVDDVIIESEPDTTSLKTDSSKLDTILKTLTDLEERNDSLIGKLK